MGHVASPGVILNKRVQTLHYSTHFLIFFLFPSEPRILVVWHLLEFLSPLYLYCDNKTIGESY
jgi:hypothetical protein